MCVHIIDQILNHRRRRCPPRKKKSNEKVALRWRWSQMRIFKHFICTHLNSRVKWHQAILLHFNNTKNRKPSRTISENFGRQPMRVSLSLSDSVDLLTLFEFAGATQIIRCRMNKQTKYKRKMFDEICRLGQYCWPNAGQRTAIKLMCVYVGRSAAASPTN